MVIPKISDLARLRATVGPKKPRHMPVRRFETIDSVVCTDADCGCDIPASGKAVSLPGGVRMTVDEWVISCVNRDSYRIPHLYAFHDSELNRRAFGQWPDSEIANAAEVETRNHFELAANLLVGYGRICLKYSACRKQRNRVNLYWAYSSAREGTLTL